MSQEIKEPLSPEVQRLVARVLLAVPFATITDDCRFVVGGLMLDFTHEGKQVCVEWRPTDEKQGWNGNRFGISLINEDTPYGANADEWIEGTEEAAIRICTLLVK